MTHVLTTPGLPRSPDFLGSVEELDPSFLDAAEEHPFGLRFLTRAPSPAEPLTGLSYDVDRQQARVDPTLRPEMKGTSGPTHVYSNTSLDGVIIRDLHFDTYTD